MIVQKATCAELVTLCCAVCLLAISRSDRQYGCNLRNNKKHEEDQERKINEENKKMSTQQHTRTYRYII